MKITALIENTSARGLPTEHGLSLFVETAEHKFLFDMGQTDLFARNAETLGIALSKVDFAVLSHGHYDHGGGLNTFLALNDHAPVYMSRYAFEPHYTSHHFPLSGCEQQKNISQPLKAEHRRFTIQHSLSPYRRRQSFLRINIQCGGSMSNGLQKMLHELTKNATPPPRCCICIKM